MTTVAMVPEATAARVRGTAWWGMMSLIATEAMIFAGLLGSYFFTRAAAKEWPLGGIEAPELPRIIVFTVVLLGSSVPIFWAEAAIRRGNVRGLRVGLFLSFVMGAVFLVNLGFEYDELTFGARDNAYGSLFYAITGLHGLHVLVGLLMNVVVQLKARLGRVSKERHVTVTVFGMYWHFVDVVWIFVFSSLYVSPHLT
jgi:heme/copper-type cytochrome/quinol oxidase subunit 3